jgi:hypothetical protein
MRRSAARRAWSRSKSAAKEGDCPMVRIRRFSVIRTANVLAVIYLIVTAIFAIPFALILSASPMTYTDQLGQTYSYSISPIFVLLVPFLYAGFGWVFTAIGCLIYNLAARFTGGVEFQAVSVDVAPAPAAGPATPPQTPPDQGPPSEGPPPHSA